MTDEPPSSPLPTAPVQGPLLAAVSRSFYLSLRFLPPPVRAPLSVSYLLARAADTIADVDAAPATARESLLEQFRQVLAETASSGPPGTGPVPVTPDASGAPQPPSRETARFPATVREFAEQVGHAGERELLRRLPECLARFQQLSPTARPEVLAVLGHILDGMILDLRRFPDSTSLRCLRTGAELDQYTWLVAGCVGEFWTAICATELPGVYTRSTEEMKTLGSRFGKGLQLINILRDQEKDASIGRCYLPEESLRAAGLTEPPAWPQAVPEGMTGSPPGAGAGAWQGWHRVRQDLIARTRGFLADGWEYAASQRSVRLRFATLMPLLIGDGTLAKMEALPADGPPRAVKVDRRSVRRMVRRALWMAITNRIRPD